MYKYTRYPVAVCSIYSYPQCNNISVMASLVHGKSRQPLSAERILVEREDLHHNANLWLQVHTKGTNLAKCYQ